MPKLVTDTIAMKAFAWDVGRVENSEGISVSQQHARNPIGGVGLGLHDDAAAGGDGERIDRQAGNPFLLKKRLGLLFGHLQAKEVAHGPPFFLLAWFRVASTLRKASAISRSPAVSLPTSR